jgi:hypothetical protein
MGAQPANALAVPYLAVLVSLQLIDPAVANTALVKAEQALQPCAVLRGQQPTIHRAHLRIRVKLVRRGVISEEHLIAGHGAGVGTPKG